MNKKNIKKELTKARKFKNSTPGQDRDFETLDANRMFKAYEDVEIDEWGDTGILDQKLAKEKQAKQKLSITPAGKKALKKGDHKLSITPKGRKALYKANVAYDTAKQASKMKYMKKAEELEVEDAPVTSTGGVANWNPLLGGRKRKVDVYMKNRRKVDGRTKDYKETVQRLQARRDASAARELEQKLNMFGVQSNPFREETEMNNKKYLQTKEGGLESAVIQSLTTEAPVNPNDARPTLTLPKKYLSSRDGSLESAVQTVMIDETISGNMMRDLRALDGHQFQAKYRMTKASAQSAGGGIQKYGRKGKVPAADEHQREAVEDEFDYKAKKGAIAAPGSGSIAKAQKAKASDVNKSLEQQLAAARKEEVEIDELSKKTMGSYVKKASADAETRMGNLERARGQAAATGQSADVDAQIRAHKPTMARLKSRPKGIARAADKLSKESKETENGERDVGSSQYLKYTTDLTPGQGITSPQAKKADVAKKIEQQRQRTAATGIDDAHQPGHKPGTPKPVPGIKSLKQKFKANRYAVRQKQARQAIATPKKEDVDLDAIIRKNLPETAVNPMGAPSNAPIGRSVIGDTAPEKVSPVSGSVATQASPSASVPGESGIEKVMDKINRIVKSGHSEKIHDKVIDKDTASAIQSTYAKVNAANQEKMEKVMSKDAAAMEKVSKFSKKNA